jgi:alcohol dehydrogenase (cytochrome c)
MNHPSRLVLFAACFASIAMAATTPVRADPVTTQDLLKAQDNAAEWLMYGRDYRNWRFSPLTQITTDNAAQLKPVWTMSTGGNFGGLESTPLFHNGVLYFSADYGRLFAVDARSGNIIWHYEPKYDQGFDAVLCCGPIHRGVALKDDLLYAARLDAQLVAFNQADGKIVWQQKIDDWKRGVTTNSAPLIVGDHVIIGVSGGEYGVRGYLKSFNAKTGALEWTTYTIPAPGEKGSETWPKDDSWKTGGGPTWLTGSYDADTNTLTGAWVIRDRGLRSSTPATICGPTTCWPSILIRARSNGASNIRPTTPGTMTAWRRRSWSM